MLSAPGLPDLSCAGLRLSLELPGTPSIGVRSQTITIARGQLQPQMDGTWQAEVVSPDGGAINVTVLRSGDDWRIAIANHDRVWDVTVVDGPLWHAVSSDGLALLWPDGLGQRHPDAAAVGRLETNYPSGRGTMAWVALAGAESGWYLGRHDASRSLCKFRAEGLNGGVQLSVEHHPQVRPGTTWTSPPLRLQAYHGGWTEACRLYRTWADSWFSREQSPAWVREQTGWLLAILKQQNGEVLWSYRDLPRVWALAKERGLSTVGLFGWAHGGHDRYYPEYLPDPAMGGESALREALAEARRLGLRTILYANGLIMDTAGEFFRWQGNEACAWKADHEPYVHSIRKFDSSTPVTFANACTGSRTWMQRMQALAEQAHDLGADGLLYDQVGVVGPFACHHPGHQHAHPYAPWAEDRVTAFAAIAASMRSRDPQFVLMTEGVVDGLCNDFAWFHGWGTGFAARPLYHILGDGDNDFPGLFRTTFPEVPLLQRFGTPMLGSEQANHALLHGLGYEIEARWPADVAFLERGELPAAEAYADCTYWPPDAKLMRSVGAEAGRSQLASLCAFVRTHSDLLRLGTYRGDAGLSGVAGLRATVFVGATRRGVMVLNPGPEPVTASPRLDGAVAVAAFAPEVGAVDPSTLLLPAGVRLYVFSTAETQR